MKINAMYSIYALVDPRDYSIRYVGMTHDVYERFKQHISCLGSNAEKNAWIRELQAENVMVIMQSLGTASTLNEARKLEAQWIRDCLAQGHPLTNRTEDDKYPRKVTTALGRQRNGDRVKAIILHRLQHGSWPEDLSSDMRSYYHVHYFKRGGKYYRKMQEWKKELNAASQAS